MQATKIFVALLHRSLRAHMPSNRIFAAVIAVSVWAEAGMAQLNVSPPVPMLQCMHTMAAWKSADRQLVQRTSGGAQLGPHSPRSSSPNGYRHLHRSNLHIHGRSMSNRSIARNSSSSIYN